MKTISRASIEFVQEANTLGTTKDPEVLEIAAEYQMPDPGKGGECFFVLQTKGWSIDGVEDLGEMVESFQKHLQEISEE